MGEVLIKKKFLGEAGTIRHRELTKKKSDRETAKEKKKGRKKKKKKTVHKISVLVSLTHSPTPICVRLAAE